MKDEISANNANSISVGIPNRELHHMFFESLWEIFKQLCQTVEMAQVFISPIHPESLAWHLNDLLGEMDQIYEGHENLENMKVNMATTRDRLNGYADQMAPLKFELFLNGTTFPAWISLHANDFKKLKSDKNLIKYLKEIKRLIEAIQISIKRHQRNIDSRNLIRFNEKISASVLNYNADAANMADLSDSLLGINHAIDEVMNVGKIWSNLKKNVGKILHDLKELELLMEKQWIDLNYILRNLKLPQKMPTVNCADKIDQ